MPHDHSETFQFCLTAVIGAILSVLCQLDSCVLCPFQVNLDFDSEADMIRKFRAGLALQPVSWLSLFSIAFGVVHANLILEQVATALFANSPFSEGKPNGYLSMRR